MDTSHEHPLGEELLRHAGWIRGLARGLVADEATAEDLVQDTWVAALTHRRPAQQRLRPWLRQVARNFARQDHRGRGRRAAREAASRPPAPLPGPEELGERLEIERLLGERLARLEEPYRSTLFLRYYEDLQPAEIARRQGVPAGTVRWRLKRGLERLRELLDQATDGDRGAWTVLLLPLARTPAPGAALAGSTTVALSGWLVMNGLLKLGVAAGALALVAVGLSQSGLMPLAGFPFRAETPLPVTFRPLPAGVEPVAQLAPAPQPVVLPTRQAVEPTGEATLATPAVAAPTRGSVEALVMDAFGAPIAGARMLARLADRSSSATSHGDGSVRLELELDETCRVRIEFHASGYASQERTLAVRPGEATHAGTIRLEPGGAIAGRVVDERGQPIARANVSLGTVDEPRSRLDARRHEPVGQISVPMCATDERGAFTLKGVPVGHARLWARAEGRIGNYTPPLEVRAGQESFGVEIVLSELPPENQIRGIVLDPSGNPVPRARLEYRHASSSAGVTMAGDMLAADDGSFRFQVHADERLWITAKHPPHGPASAADVRTGAVELVLQLTSLEPVSLLVVGADREPVQTFAFEVLSTDEQFTFQTGARRREDPGGVTFGLPAERFLVRVTAPGFDLATAGPFASGDPSLLEDGITIRLAPLPGLRGLVLAGGEPLAGATVQLLPAVEKGTRYERNGFLSRVRNEVLDEARTDEEGRFLLTVRAEGDYFLRAEHAGHAPAELGPMALGPAFEPAPVELRLGRGGALEGRVHAAPGNDPTGAIVGISRGDGQARTQRVGQDGTYRFDGLTPGPWLVTLRDEEIFPEVTTIRTSNDLGAPDHDDIEWSCEVYEGETTFHDLHAENVTLLPFQGRLVVDGEPAATWVARLAPASSFFMEAGPKTLLDGDGRFTLESTEGDLQLVLSPRADATAESYLIDAVRLPQGEPWERALTTGTLIVEGLAPWDGHGPPELVHLWEGPGGLYALTPLGGDADGLCRLEKAFAGHGKLCRPNREQMLDPRSWEVVREVEVPARGEVRASVR